MSAQTCRGGALRSASGLLLASLLVVFALVAALPARALADDETSYPELTTDNSITVGSDDVDDYYYYYMTFTPTEDDTYVFTLAYNTDSIYSTFGWLDVYDSEGNYVGTVNLPTGSYNGDSASTALSLSAGEEYLLKFWGSFLDISGTYSGTYWNYVISVVQGYEEPSVVEMTADVTYGGTISVANTSAYYSFTPSSDGWYCFSMVDVEESYVMAGYLYDSDGNLVASAEEYDNEGDVIAELEAGETYYLAVGYASDSTSGDFTVSVSAFTILEFATENTVDLDDGDAYYTFTPTESGYYTFSLTVTAASEGESDVHLALKDSPNDTSYYGFAYVDASSGETLTGTSVSYLNAGQTYYVWIWTNDNYEAPAEVTASVSSNVNDVTETGSYQSGTLEDVYLVGTCFAYETASTGVYRVSVNLSNSGYGWYASVYDAEGNYVNGIAGSDLLLAGETTYYIILVCYADDEDDADENSLSFAFSIELLDEDEMNEITLDSSYTYESDATDADIYVDYDEYLYFTATVAGTYTFTLGAEGGYSIPAIYIYDGNTDYLGGVLYNPGSVTLDLEQGETVYLHLYTYTSEGSTATYTVSVTLDAEKATDDADDDATDDDATADADDDATDEDSTDSDADDDATDDSDADADDDADDEADDSTSDTTGSTGSTGGSASGSAGGNAAGGSSAGGGNTVGGGGFADTGDSTGMVAVAAVLAAVAALAVAAATVRKRVVR